MKSRQRKLTDEQARQIREEAAKGVRTADLVSTYGVGHGTIYAILTGTCYKDQGPDPVPLPPKHKRGKEDLEQMRRRLGAR